LVEARLAAADSFHDIPLISQHAPQGGSDAGFVINNQDGRHVHLFEFGDLVIW
jgi:hypothetical protein